MLVHRDWRKDDETNKRHLNETFLIENARLWAVLSYSKCYVLRKIDTQKSSKICDFN